MSYTPALLTLLEKTLAPTGYCVGDMLDHGMGDWHASVGNPPTFSTYQK